METIDQEVIDDNKEIYARIQSELIKAESEILIATAWFTDDDLFNILLSKLKEGVLVEVVVADNQENERLDFNQLEARGARVYKIKGSGYGGMNQKFCVIDKRIALHGSYNWTLNAKKNNQESIIVTNHEQTVQSLIQNFENVKNKILAVNAEPVARIPERPKGILVDVPIKTGADFEKVLDSMIAAEVGSFDRNLLQKQGFERCKANNGDHQVLAKAFDTVYSVFINDIDVIDDKKKRLMARIEEHRLRTQDGLASNADLQIEHLEREHQLSKGNVENRQTSLGAELELLQHKIDSVRSVKVPSVEKLNWEIDQRIKTAEQEFIRPKFKWFEVIPVSVFCLALLIYLFIFYSSAAYILLFSVADAKEAQLSGAVGAPAVQVFNPAAMGKALHKGGTAPLFIFLFVFIPLAFAVMDAFVRGMWAQIAAFVFGIIILDGAVAYKVTEAVHDANYLSGNVTDKWHFSLAFTDSNFYLVFVFGAFGLLLFKVVFKKLMRAFEERDPDIAAQRNQVLIRQLKEEIAGNQIVIDGMKEEAGGFEKEIIQLKADMKHADSELAALPIALGREVKRKKEQLANDKDTVDKTAAVYVVHIQSDNLPISVDALKDRINVFLEGWNDFLFDEFAVNRATIKTKLSLEAAMIWQNDKLQKNRIDKRIKFESGE
jgi:hypothetical protein